MDSDNFSQITGFTVNSIYDELESKSIRESVLDEVRKDLNHRNSHRMSSIKKVFLEISQNSQENTCARDSFLIKLKGPATFLKKNLWQRSFPAIFAKFLRTPFFTEHLRMTGSKPHHQSEI